MKNCLAKQRLLEISSDYICSTGRAGALRRELNHKQREQQSHNDKDLAKINETVDLINLIELNHPQSIHCEYFLYACQACSYLECES